MTDKIKTHVKSLGSDMVIIPGGLTSQVQPADVSWNKPFKAELYNEWMANGEKSYTPAGNMRPPDKKLCLEWVKLAWSQVSTEVVVNSFKACGISSSTEGSEDSLIHCLKPGDLAHDAAELIARETTALNSSTTQLDNSFEDPFKDLDDFSEKDDETLIEDD